MEALSKTKITEKGQAYLKSSEKESCFVTEDGTVFNAENSSHARNHADSLKRSQKGFEAIVTEVKASKAKAKTEAAKPVEAKVEDVVESKSPTTKGRKKPTGK